jgi:hypothetical protein
MSAIMVPLLSTCNKPAGSGSLKNRNQIKNLITVHM